MLLHGAARSYSKVAELKRLTAKAEQTARTNGTSVEKELKSLKAHYAASGRVL